MRLAKRMRDAAKLSSIFTITFTIDPNKVVCGVCFEDNGIGAEKYKKMCCGLQDSCERLAQDMAVAMGWEKAFRRGVVDPDGVLGESKISLRKVDSNED